MSSSKKIYSMHPNVVAGEHGQHHARIADSYRLSILLTHMSYRACVLCRVRRRRTRRVRRRGPAPRDDARIGAVWPPGYGVRLVSDTAAVLRTGDCCHRPAVARPRASRMASHGHAVGPWRRAGVAVPHLALISLEAASRSSRRVKTVVSSHRYDPRIDSICETLCRSHIGRHGPRRMAYLMCRHMIARRRAYRRPYNTYIDAHHPPQLAPPPSRRAARATRSARRRERVKVNAAS